MYERKPLITGIKTSCPAPSRKVGRCRLIASNLCVLKAPKYGFSA